MAPTTYACVDERYPFASHPVEYEDDGMSWEETTRALSNERTRLKKVTKQAVIAWLGSIRAMRAHRLLAVAEQSERVHVLLKEDAARSAKHVVVTAEETRVIGRMAEFDTFPLSEKNVK
jgi:hypothetical protein